MHGGELCKTNSIEVLGKFPGVMPDAPFDVIKDAVMVFAASLGRAKVACHPSAKLLEVSNSSEASTPFFPIACICPCQAAIQGTSGPHGPSGRAAHKGKIGPKTGP